jgi:hypothetical protein
MMATDTDGGPTVKSKLPVIGLLGDMVVGGLAALLQGTGVLLLLTLIVGLLLISVFDVIGTSTIQLPQWGFFGVLIILLMLGGPFLLSRYQGNAVGRALFCSVGGSLLAVPLATLPLFTVAFVGEERFAETIVAGNAVMALPLYVAIVDGFLWVLHAQTSGSTRYAVVLSTLLAIGVIIVLETARLVLIYWGFAATNAVMTRAHWIITLIYATLVGMYIPGFIYLFSKSCTSTWQCLGPLVVLGMVALAVSTTLSIVLH